MPDFSAFNVNPRAALGVRVTLGRQPPDRSGSGFPIAKDRFWLCFPIADAVQTGGRTQRFLPLAGGFERFNLDPFLTLEQWEGAKHGDQWAAAFASLPSEQRQRWTSSANQPDRQRMQSDREAHRKPRRTIRGTLIRRDAWTDVRRGLDGSAYLRRSAIEGNAGGERIPATRDRSPGCISEDGAMARRYTGRQDNDGRPLFETRPCPGERCPFAQKGSGPMGSQACQKSVSLVFQLRWPDVCWRCSGSSASCPECKGTGKAQPLPCPIAELEFGGTYNHAADAIAGFFADVEAQWRLMGIPGEPDVYGLPFRIDLVHKTGEGTAFWTATMGFDFAAGQTLQEWALWRARAQHEGRALLTVAPDEAPGARRAVIASRHPEQAIPGEVLP